MSQQVNCEEYDVIISKGEKLSFAAGDLYSGGAQTLISTVYLVFLVINGLSPSLAASIVMLAKIWDAVTDPLMGLITDNTRTKWGRRKPYLFVGAIMIVFSFTMLFLPLYKVDSVGLKYLVYIIAFLFYSTVSTMVNVPYFALATEMTGNYYEKNKINALRLVFSMTSGALSAGIPIILIERLQKGLMRVDVFSLIMILGFGFFYALPLLITAIKCQERLPIPQNKTRFSIKSFLKPLKLKAFIYLMLMYLCAYSCMDLISANLVFFVDYGINVTSYSSFILLALMMVSYAAMIPIHNRLMSKNYAKPFLYRMGIPLYMAGIVMLCLFPTSFNDYLVLPLAMLIGVGMSGCQLMPWFIFPDVMDVAELKFGERNTGSFSGFMTFIRKSTAAVAIGITGIVLDLTGFVRPVTDPLTGLTQKFPQPPTAVWGLRMVIMIPVLIFITIALISSIKLKLNPERSLMIKDVIYKRNNGLADTITTEQHEELDKISQELF